MRLPARFRQRRPTQEPGLPRPHEREEGSSRPETLELPELQSRRSGSTPNPAIDPGDPDTTSDSGESTHSLQPPRKKTALGTFWTTHVSIVVQPEASRDHLGMLRCQLPLFCSPRSPNPSWPACDPEPLPGFPETTRPVAAAAACRRSP